MSDRGGQMDDIYSLTLDGSPPRLLHSTPATREYAPAVSPDGSTIAFRSYNDLWLMGSDGSNARPLGLNGDRPSWSPDGLQIAFHALGPESGAEVYLVNADGTGLRRVTSHIEGQSSTWPTFSPDGTQIAFVREGDLWIVGVDGSNERRLLVTSSAFAPAWSPDGRTIAFAATGDDGKTDIYLVGADGAGARRIVTTPGMDSAPAWSPDASRLAFYSERDGNAELYVTNADGSGQTRLTHDGGIGGPRDGAPSWDPSSGSYARRGPANAPRALLKVRVGARQRLRRGRITLTVRARPGTRIHARGRLRIRGMRPIAFRSQRRTVRTARPTPLVLRLRAPGRTRAARALRGPRVGIAAIRVSAVDGAGARAGVRRRIVVPR